MECQSIKKLPIAFNWLAPIYNFTYGEKTVSCQERHPMTAARAQTCAVQTLFTTAGHSVSHGIDISLILQIKN